MLTRIRVYQKEWSCNLCLSSLSSFDMTGCHKLGTYKELELIQLIALDAKKSKDCNCRGGSVGLVFFKPTFNMCSQTLPPPF